VWWGGGGDLGYYSMVSSRRVGKRSNRVNQGQDLPGVLLAWRLHVRQVSLFRVSTR